MNTREKLIFSLGGAHALMQSVRNVFEVEDVGADIETAIDAWMKESRDLLNQLQAEPSDRERAFLDVLLSLERIRAELFTRGVQCDERSDAFVAANGLRAGVELAIEEVMKLRSSEAKEKKEP